MSLIGLIRHGSTIWNKEGRAQGLSNIPLDEDGLNQAKALADRLSKEDWDVIYSSDLLRARQTAEIIAERRGMKNLILDERLREMKGGKIEGTTEEERVKLWGTNWRDLDLDIESAESVIQRGADFVEEISNKQKGLKVLIISHGALIGFTLKKLIPHVNTEVHLKNTSITRLKKMENQWECEIYNCTIHLDNLQM